MLELKTIRNKNHAINFKSPGFLYLHVQGLRCHGDSL